MYSNNIRGNWTSWCRTLHWCLLRPKFSKIFKCFVQTQGRWSLNISKSLTWLKKPIKVTTKSNFTHKNNRSELGYHPERNWDFSYKPNIHGPYHLSPINQPKTYNRSQLWSLPEATEFKVQFVANYQPWLQPPWNRFSHHRRYYFFFYSRR